MGIIIKPLVTEKMTAITEKLNRFGFIVRPEAMLLNRFVRLTMECRPGRAYFNTAAALWRVAYWGVVSSGYFCHPVRAQAAGRLLTDVADP